MVWVYDRTDSVLVAMAMHASLTASVRIFDPVPMSWWAIALYILAFGAALWIVVAVIAMRGRGAGRPTRMEESIWR